MKRNYYVSAENILKDLDIFIKENSNNSILESIINELSIINQRCELKTDNAIFGIIEKTIKISEFITGIDHKFSIDVMCYVKGYDTGMIILQGHYVNIEYIVLDVYDKKGKKIYFKVFIPVNSNYSLAIVNCDSDNENSNIETIIGNLKIAIDDL